MGNLETDVLAELQAFIQTLKHSSRGKRKGLEVSFERLEEHKTTLSALLDFRARQEVNQQTTDQLSAVSNVSKVQRDRKQSRKMQNAGIAAVRADALEYIRIRKQQAQGLQGVLSHQRTFHMKPEASWNFQEQIREWSSQSKPTRVDDWNGTKLPAGMFKMPAIPSYTINSGDVVVHVTLPNVTNSVSPTQLEMIGNRLGRGLQNGRVGSLRDQLLMNPTTAYRSSASY
ncbi:hypothetical protein ACFQ5D_02830 [Paenibacillus farraposensis]|uniref:Uncharacterized protein n=1 Tax=Paenibacillus farraposensis TaxID=2807095 RepID=A0ABW4D6R2_9BACL|nr:hypothetical protein [Paenibacillus farraposensis]MCC3381827.1 hypothetical protein [Paenibacillus farraposensis]